MFDLSEYIGRDVVTDIYELSDQILNFEFDGDSGSFDLSYRRYSQDKNSEECQWFLTTSIYFELDGNAITDIIKRAVISSRGDSGLGECDPDDEWTNEDYKKAKNFLDRITIEPFGDASNHKLLNREEFKAELEAYFKKYHHCDDNEIAIIWQDLEDPYAVYRLPYYRSEFEETVTIDGKNYSKERCWFDFTMFGTFSNKYPFVHHIYYNLPEGSHTVQDYVDADKLYEVEILDKEK